MLRATTACNFSSLTWAAGSARAALASLLLDPHEHQIIGKTQCFATFLPFLASASSYSFSSTLLSSNLSLLSASSLLCFSSVHIVGSLTSKLPSMITYLAGRQSLHKRHCCLGSAKDKLGVCESFAKKCCFTKSGLFWMTVFRSITMSVKGASGA